MADWVTVHDAGTASEHAGPRPDDACTTAMTARIVDERVRLFALFLRSSWPTVAGMNASAEGEDLWGDWLQANWEVLVEGALPPGTFLEVYGDGADCNSGSSRVFRPDAETTHRVVCRARSETHLVRDYLSGRDVVAAEDELALEELVTLAGTWFERSPPFDCVLVEGAGDTYVFKLDDVQFALRAVRRG